MASPTATPTAVPRKTSRRKSPSTCRACTFSALVLQGGNGESQAVSGDLDHRPKEHHGDAIVDEAFPLDDNAEPLDHGEFLEQCHHGNGVGGRQHGGGDQANLPAMSPLIRLATGTKTAVVSTMPMMTPGMARNRMARLLLRKDLRSTWNAASNSRMGRKTCNSNGRAAA